MCETNIDAKYINLLMDEEISRYWNIEPKSANSNQIYRALSVVIRDILLKKHNKFKSNVEKNNQKQVYYMCMEFLIGKSLRNNLYNLNIEKEAEIALKKYSVKLDELYATEKDPGLGNGGLGRLAACFME